MKTAQADDPASIAKSLRILLDESVKNAHDSWEVVRLSDPAKQILAAAPEVQIRFIMHAADDVAATMKQKSYLGGTSEHEAAATLCAHLLRRKLPWNTADLAHVMHRTAELDGIAIFRAPYIPQLVSSVSHFLETNGLDEHLSGGIQRLADALASVSNAPQQKLRRSLHGLLQSSRQLSLDVGEPWAAEALRDIEKAEAHRAAWMELIEHAMAVPSGRPSKKWIDRSRELVERIGWKAFRERVLVWFPLVDKPRVGEVVVDWRWQHDREWMITEPSADALRGLVLCCSLRNDAEVARALTTLALSSYRKVPGIGPRLVRVGNACISALGQMPGQEGVGQLSLLKVKVKFGTAQKEIDKALSVAAERLGLPRDEIEEMAVPAYGMEDIGVRREQFGEFTAELAITGTTTTELRWLKSDGKPQKSVPAAVQKDHAEELKELKQAGKDIQKMLPAQRDRIDMLFLEQKSWPYATWRQRYLDHPLVGTLARRLIWRFKRGGRVADGIYLDGRFVDAKDQAVDWLDDSATASLWHPIDEPLDAVLAWRRWLTGHEVRQPFKQAHREVYLLTDAERNTEVYSNRFAAHVLRQHQFNALCAVRGWKNKLRLLVDAEFPPATRLLPRWNLRAEFWIEGIGDEYGQDTNETGTFYRLSTDQVRFYPIDAAERTAHAGGGRYGTRGPDGSDTPIPLERIPPLVFSEIMRDVDLFVGVASVGNDPTWSDGGPEGRYRDYWLGYAFGDLSETAKTRRELLETLLPRLKISPRCSLAGRFLIVRGDIRTYKIHLGSGNIMMEPNDQYLCIVQGRGGAKTSSDDRLYLPFEGDSVMAVILSKAFLLAEDTKIKDPTITRQIKG